MNKVYIVRNYNRIWGVYATKEKAEEERKHAQMDAEMGGNFTIYGIEEYEVEK